MRYTIILFLLFAGNVAAQDTDSIAAALMNAQVKAFNDKDVDALCANIHPEFKWYYVYADSMQLEVEGIDAFRQGMEEYYKRYQQVESSVLKYHVNYNNISFLEEVQYVRGDGWEASTSLGIYRIKDNKIYRAWYILRW